MTIFVPSQREFKLKGSSSSELLSWSDALKAMCPKYVAEAAARNSFSASTPNTPNSSRPGTGTWSNAVPGMRDPLVLEAELVKLKLESSGKDTQISQLVAQVSQNMLQIQAQALSLAESRTKLEQETQKVISLERLAAGKDEQMAAMKQLLEQNNLVSQLGAKLEMLQVQQEQLKQDQSAAVVPSNNNNNDGIPSLTHFNSASVLLTFLFRIEATVSRHATETD